MSRLPTDREVLRCIFEMYELNYLGEPVEGKGANDPYVPVDLRAVAERFHSRTELIFGLLYFDLHAKRRYERDDGVWVNLFHLNIQNKGHSVHSLYLTAILVGQEQEHRKQLWSMAFSTLALVLSVASLVTNLLTKN